MRKRLPENPFDIERGFIRAELVSYDDFIASEVWPERGEGSVTIGREKL